MLSQITNSEEYLKFPAALRRQQSRGKLFNTVLTLSVFISALTSTTFVPAAEAVDVAAKFDTHNVLRRAAASGNDFDWQKLTPSPTLKWADCYTHRQCARLEVPLDYSSPNGDKAAIALLRIKSNVSSDSKEYRGPLLFNPGGPGGSGVAVINEFGEMLRNVVGAEYDIVGFDPRGIGETTPPVSIFANEVDRAYWSAGDGPLLNSTDSALSELFFRAEMFNDLVEARSKRAAQHVSTAVVARDMLSITKAHGRDRLQYWGISYGTVLGATYAAMFPNNIERLVIDGVVDFDDYYSGSWSKNLFDTDKVLQFLYDKCASAGSACPLHASSGSLVRQRVETLLDSLKANPVRAINGTDYGLIDFTGVKKLLFGALYTPFSLFPPLAEALAALERGDGRPALTLLRADQPLPECNTPVPLGNPMDEASAAVKCGDAAAVPNSTEEVTLHFEQLSKMSIFADVWTESTYIDCVGWKVRPTERFAGPFSVNTSFPLLIIGNTADPVTPIVGAQKANRGFGGSVLLTIDTPGHTSIAATSPCAMKAVRDYFTQGELPKNGTVCEIEDVLFGRQASTPQNLTARDADLLAATRTLKTSELMPRVL